MCTWVGVPSVSTTWSAAAASATVRVRSKSPSRSTCSSSSCVPVSLNGIVPAPRERSTASSRSTPITRSPRLANESARGRPTRPRPMTATLCSMVVSLRPAGALGDQLPGHGDHEARVEPEVARQQAARLLRDAVDPLEAALLHPSRRLRDAPRVEVEGRPDSAHDGHVERRAHARHPLLLLGHADAHPEHVGLGSVDLLDHGGLLLARERAEGRRVAADDLDARVLAAQAEGELSERALVAPAVEPDAVAALGAAAGVAAGQPRPPKAGPGPPAPHVERPDQARGAG